jgi:hypothetical protein
MQLFNLPDRKTEYGMTFTSWMMIKQVLKKARKRDIFPCFFSAPLIMQGKTGYRRLQGASFHDTPFVYR